MPQPVAVLAFSGGLDTSYCVLHLQKAGFDVVTVFVDTGGFTDSEREQIRARASELGAVEHREVDAGAELWREFVVPMVWGGQLYQGQYPLLCSDRYLIVRHSVGICDELGAQVVAHGCTGMGNDQVRFDQTIRALCDLEIRAPIREIQEAHRNVREFEAEVLRESGVEVPDRTSQYSINQNLLGATVSGSEIDRWEPPGESSYSLTQAHEHWPRDPLRLTLTFEQGVAVALDGTSMEGPALLARLNTELGRYGVGRAIYTGDTTVGLKGRIVFESPGLRGLLTAHQALEECVLTARQNRFKSVAALEWVDLVYKGFFYEPLRTDVEALLASTQKHVTGSVTLEAIGGQVSAVALETPHLLQRRGDVYAQSAGWTQAEAEGFIKLLGQSSTLWAEQHLRKGGG